MDNKVRCQSCGMPLGVGYYGTNADNTANTEFCKLCFESGNFREPNLTLNEMIGRSIANMVDEQHIEREKAEELAQKVIPNLKRWKQV